MKRISQWLFGLPQRQRPSPWPPTGIQVSIAFALYLSVNMLLIPSASALWALLEKIHNFESRGWFGVLGIVSSTVVLALYTVVMKNPTKVWEQWSLNPRTRLLEMMRGSLAWIIAFPLVTLSIYLLDALLSLYIAVPPLDQVAAQHLKNTLGYPTLFIATAIGIGLFAPIAEEILFRGFLQNWLRDGVGWRLSIVLTSLVFAVFHYAPSQGWGNVELLVALFLLSVFLGLLYEQKRALWAPIALHAVFNSISTIMIAKST